MRKFTTKSKNQPDTADVSLTHSHNGVINTQVIVPARKY